MGVLWVLVLCCLAFVGTWGASQQGGNFCGAGFHSTTGRLWALRSLKPATTNSYDINICATMANTTGSCTGDAVLCNNGVNLGRRANLAINSDNNVTLVVTYALGDICSSGNVQYQVQVTMHCQDANAGTFTAQPSSSDPCKYTADLYVPTSMCAVTPTAVAPYCQPDGYFDTQTGATWKLSGLSFDQNISGTTYQMNLCGTRTDLTCNANSVLCQGGNSLGSRAYWDIAEFVSNGTTLVTTYAFGDDCGNGIGDRRAFMFFHCTTGTTASFTSTELSGRQCNYVINVNVPASMCTAGTYTGTAPLRPPPFCEPAGFTTQNNVVYTLYNADFGSFSSTTFDYVLNPCGTQLTTCGTYSALCQEQSSQPSFSLGEWTSWSFRAPTETMGLSVHYALGDGGRQFDLNLHCNGTGQITYTIVESPPGHYSAEVSVPPSYCGYASATTPVIPDAPFCTASGYYSDGRTWYLSNYNPSSINWVGSTEDNFEFNLCGTVETLCNTNSMLCQQDEHSTTAPYSLANRQTYDVRTDLSNSTFLVVDYGMGDWCGAQYRRVTVSFYCQNIPVGTVPAWTVSEPTTCSYQVTVPVPLAYCPTSEPPVVAPFCDPNYGYFSPTNRLWSLSGLTASVGANGYDLVLDVCGKQQNPCAVNSVLCQVTSPTFGYSVGDRNHYSIDTILSTDTTLVVNFALGDDCGGFDRSAHIYFHCMVGYTAAQYQTNLTSNETSPCRYKIDVYVAEDYCHSAQPTTAPVTLPICNQNGYISPSGTVWNIANFNPDTTMTGGYDVNLNLCGTSTTLCGTGSAVCQEGGSMYNMGSRSAGVIDLSLSNSNTLAIYYGNGDPSYCNNARNVLVIFKCQSGTYTPSMTVVEISQCSYVVTVNTPSTMCYTYQATSAPVAPPPFCNGAGYKSATNRLWTLEFFNMEATIGYYDYILDICGHGTVTPWCPAGSALCQESDRLNNNGQGYSLGSWWAYDIVPQANQINSDLTLTVKYGFGDNCGQAGNREVTINFHCILGPYVENFTISESPAGSCRYVADIAVPSSYCREAVNIPTAPWCTPNGYYSPTNRLWNLNSYVPLPVNENGGTYVLDLCGNELTTCDYQSVTCQEYFGSQYSFALRSTYSINKTASCDDTLVIEYGLGDYCGAAGRDRLATMRLHCNGDPNAATSFVVSEPTTCHYFIDAYVPPSMCQIVTPTAAPTTPVYCKNPGYISATGRAWLLAGFAPDEYQDTGSAYDVKLNPCGAVVTTCDSNGLPGSIMCQETDGTLDGYQWSLGSIYSYTITEKDDLTLSVTYGNGEYCAAGNGYRNLTVNYHCSTNTALIVPANLTYHEGKTCNYIADVTVPYTMCSAAQAGTLPPVAAPFCYPNGYYQNGVLWKLRNFQSPLDQQGQYDFVLNLCDGSTTTFCDDSTVLCQEYNDQSSYSLGTRSTWSIVPQTDPTQLVVLYGFGSDTFCNRPRSVFIYFHCTDDPVFDVTENDEGINCNYRLDANVPTSMCQLQSPTSQPGPTLPVYCSADGYVSPTNRQWLLGQFTSHPDFQNGYEWTLDLCDQDINLQCPDNVVMCQSGWNLGLRSTSHINTTASDDTTLVINYSLGDNCGAYDRMSTLKFHCGSAPSNLDYTFTVGEGPTCVYTADIYLPSEYCPYVGGPPTEPPAPYCQQSGLYLNGRTWNFATLTAEDPEFTDGYDYVLDVCGQTTKSCRYDSVICQEASMYGNNYWSLGSRSVWEIDKEQSTADTLAVYYGLGDDSYCYTDSGNSFPRSITVFYQCAALTNSPEDFLVYSTGPCTYQALINVGLANCPQTSAPPALPSFCTTDGYISATNRRWTLANLDVNDQIGTYDFLLNLCGEVGTTACPSSSVSCQVVGDSSGYNLGSRANWAVLPTSTDTVLRTTFSNGDGGGACPGPRVTNIVFNCAGNGLVFAGPVEENPTCTYNMVINIPTSMCQPASIINTEAPWCNAGYLFTTNSSASRLWTLGDLSPHNADQTGYDFLMDLCGQQTTACAPGAVVCQQDDGGGVYNLGSRFAWTVLPTSDDLNLRVLYGMGDDLYCAGPRYSVVNFHCVTDGYANYNEFTVSNFADYNCGYNVTINVPSTMCSTASPTNPPVPAAPWCTNGYLFGDTLWTLSQFTIDASNGADFTLNLCGTFNTICDPSAVACNSDGVTVGSWAWSTGNRATWNVLEDQSDDSTLVVKYLNGDDCGGYGARQTYLRFHCGGNTSTWNTTESPTCTYTLDLNVPDSMCQQTTPSAPVPVADFCNPKYGYQDDFGTLWSLSSYTAADPTTAYDYVLDICGNQPTTCTNTATVLCQEYSETYGASMGDRSTAFIRTDLSSNGLLIVDYGNGDNCGGYGNRKTRLYLSCADDDTQFMNVTEGPTCTYNVYANIPTRLCRPTPPTAAPLPAAPFCKTDGYVSPTNRVWKLGRLNPNDQEGDYDYQLDLCGNIAIPCDPNAVLCQEEDGDFYNLGFQHTYNIIASQSNDTTLVVKYGLGDYCGDIEADRTAELHFYCTDQPRSSFKVTEVTECVYRGDVYVAKSLCGTTLPTTPPLPDICTAAGHLDTASGRYWTMQKFLEIDMQGDYAFQVNLCGNSPTQCNTQNAAVCQLAGGTWDWSLGSRYNFSYLPSQNGMLSMLYQGGDWCDAANISRSITVNLNCTDTGIESALENETSTCQYTLTVQVPTKYCSTDKPVVPTSPPISEKDFCQSEGYTASTGRQWSLLNFAPDYATLSTYNYVLNLCGTTPNNCDGTAAICQERFENLGWSLGSYDNYTIDDSKDGVLTLHYRGGDFCNVSNSYGNETVYAGDRQSTVILTCTDSNFTSFNVTEGPTPCHYTVTASVPTTYCVSTIARDQNQGSTKSLGSGAIAGITVGVVGVAVVGGAIGAFRVLKVKNARRFQHQTNESTM